MENIWLMIASKCKFAERFGRKTNRFEIRGSVFESGSNESLPKNKQRRTTTSKLMSVRRHFNFSCPDGQRVTPELRKVLLRLPPSFSFVAKAFDFITAVVQESLTFVTINLLAGEIYKFSMEATDGFWGETCAAPTSQPLTHPRPDKRRKSCIKADIQAEHATHGWETLLAVHIIDPIYLANKALCDNPHTPRNESSLKSIGKANFVLQRQRRKKSVIRSIDEESGGCFMIHAQDAFQSPFSVQ